MVLHRPVELAPGYGKSRATAGAVCCSAKFVLVGVKYVSKISGPVEISTTECGGPQAAGHYYYTVGSMQATAIFRIQSNAMTHLSSYEEHPLDNRGSRIGTGESWGLAKWASLLFTPSL
jgi:hypothetical protein